MKQRKSKGSPVERRRMEAGEMESKMDGKKRGMGNAAMIGGMRAWFGCGWVLFLFSGWNNWRREMGNSIPL